MTLLLRNNLNSIRSLVRSSSSFSQPCDHLLRHPPIATLPKTRLFSRDIDSKDSFIRRAYDKYRAYIATHFVVGEYKIENMASLGVLVFTFIGFCSVWYLEIALNAFNGPHDVNMLPEKGNKVEEQKS